MTPHVSTTLLRTQTDQRLVELIAAGHDRAFDAIVDRYRRPLMRYARRFLREDARAEDVVQSAFVSAWTALNEGTTVRDLRPWLYRIVHNGAVNAMKKPGRDDAILIEASDLRPGPAAEVEQREDVRQALDTISRLPERQRTALLAVAFDGRSHADVGAELGLKEPAVRQLVSRARTNLRVAATAITPWPVAAWLAGVGGAQAGDTAARVGEIAGGVGAGTVFGGGAIKAGALVAAAGAVAVSAPKMAEVAHHHPHHAVATASAATTSHAKAGGSSTPDSSAPATAPGARLRVVSSAAGGLTAGVRAHGHSGVGGASGGSHLRTQATTRPGSWTPGGSPVSTSTPAGTAPVTQSVGESEVVSQPRSTGDHTRSERHGGRWPSSTQGRHDRHRSSGTSGDRRSAARTPATGVTGDSGSRRDGSRDGSRTGTSTWQSSRSDRVEHRDSTDTTSSDSGSGTESGSSAGSDGGSSSQTSDTPESGTSRGSGETQPSVSTQTPTP